jgi:hypothetical protein
MGCIGSAVIRARVFFQPFSPSHGVLARTPVCKPFVRECWLVRNDRWSVDSHIRKYRGPKNTRV